MGLVHSGIVGGSPLESRVEPKPSPASGSTPNRDCEEDDEVAVNDDQRQGEHPGSVCDGGLLSRSADPPDVENIQRHEGDHR